MKLIKHLMEESNIRPMNWNGSFSSSLCGFLRECVRPESIYCGTCPLSQKEDYNYICELNPEIDKKRILEEIKIKLLLGG